MGQHTLSAGMLKQTLSKLFRSQSGAKKDSHEKTLSPTCTLDNGCFSPLAGSSSSSSSLISLSQSTSSEGDSHAIGHVDSPRTYPAPTNTKLAVNSAPSTPMLAMSPTLPRSMQRSTWCLADYQITEKLYKGYASTVYKALCKRSHEWVVLKIYHLKSICELYQYQIFREVRLHASLQHENIITLHAAFQEGDQVVLVQEYADGSDLFNLLQKYGGRLGERTAVQLVLDPFLRVLQYLHSRMIVHRDIKPENILFDKNMTLKLADFGLAIDLRQERAVTRAGTLDYMAPEVLACPYKSHPEENKEKVHLHYSNGVDAWAVGVLTYELLVGFPPFFDQTRQVTEDRIRSSVPMFPAGMTEEARSFILSALAKRPEERPTMLELLHNPWLESHRNRRSMRQIGTLSELSSQVSGRLKASMSSRNLAVPATQGLVKVTPLSMKPTASAEGVKPGALGQVPSQTGNKALPTLQKVALAIQQVNRKLPPINTGGLFGGGESRQALELLDSLETSAKSAPCLNPMKMAIVPEGNDSDSDSTEATLSLANYQL